MACSIKMSMRSVLFNQLAGKMYRSTLSCNMTRRISIRWKSHSESQGYIRKFPGCRTPISGRSSPNLSCSLTVLNQYCTVVRSPYPDLNIPENVSLPHYMLGEFSKYGDLVALVGIKRVFYSHLIIVIRLNLISRKLKAIINFLFAIVVQI